VPARNEADNIAGCMQALARVSCLVLAVIVAAGARRHAELAR
jgi:hypothetical protein